MAFNLEFMKKIRIILELIKFEHTIFALPFAYLGMVLGARGIPDISTLIWITLAMVGARSYAMAVNRLFDKDIDSRNPRTMLWPLAQGQITVLETLTFAFVSLILFLIAVYSLPPLCHMLWPVVIVPMTIYSLAKRFTYLSHFFLGLCLGLAPIASWVAVTNSLPTIGVLALGFAVMFWTTGFDIIYSCQDYDFDKKEELYSIPVRFGMDAALKLTKLLHALTVVLLFFVGIHFSLNFIYYFGVMLIALFLWYENSIVTPTDLSRVNVSFFAINGFVSIFGFVFTYLSVKF
jgi:4-hydroxybenzoate polyprenyltransferase